MFISRFIAKYTHFRFLKITANTAVFMLSILLISVPQVAFASSGKSVLLCISILVTLTEEPQAP